MSNTPSKPKKPAAHYDPVAEWDRQQQDKKRIEERRGEVRYPFTASAEITDLRSGTTLHARTADLSANGCYVDTMGPLGLGTKVRVKIVREKKTLETEATVNYSQPGVGMGLKFADLAGAKRRVLDYWVAQLSGNPLPEPEAPPEPIAAPKEEDPRAAALAKLIQILARNGHITEAEAQELLREIRG